MYSMLNLHIRVQSDMIGCEHFANVDSVHDCYCFRLPTHDSFDDFLMLLEIFRLAFLRDLLLSRFFVLCIFVKFGIASEPSVISLGKYGRRHRRLRMSNPKAPAWA
jgi:hypothetical protein